MQINQIKVGIDKIGMYIPEFVLPIDKLAQARNVDPDKFKIGIGQSKMAVVPLWQDIVSMGANAAYQILTPKNREEIDQIIFATESSFDFSKSAATYVHELLQIKSNVRSIEMKQACYSGTAALQSALDYVRLRPNRKVLIIMSDISKYGLDTAAEVTQGAGAIALIISSNPRILAIDSESVCFTNNEHDFWRPAYSDIALVDGHYSTELYMSLFSQLMHQYKLDNPEKYKQIEAVNLHLPFTRIAEKSFKKYLTDYPEEELSVNKWEKHLPNIIKYGYKVGNIYTGSLYLSLLSLLIEDETLKANDRIALFSYGSGAVAELFTGTLQTDYEHTLNKSVIEYQFDRREEIDIEKYEWLYNQELPQTEKHYDLKVDQKESTFYLSHIDGHRRFYRHSSK